MPEDWSKLSDVDLLADGRVHIELAIALSELPRLRPRLAHATGRLAGQVRFGRERGIPVADVEVSARAVLVCQRCLTPLECPVESRGKVALVADAAEADRVQGELETVLAPDHRVSLRDLVEEELLLALPLVPLHEVSECSAPGSATVGSREAAQREVPREEKQRPFERLDELLRQRS